MYMLTLLSGMIAANPIALMITSGLSLGLNAKVTVRKNKFHSEEYLHEMPIHFIQDTVCLYIMNI